MALLQSLTIAAGFFIFQGVLYMKKYCTIKERKQAARILAAREGLEKINDDIIQRVGSMSDADIIKFLDDNIKPAAAAVEVLQPGSVEEITPGSGSDYTIIYNALVDVVNNYIVSNNWDGEKITPLQWASCCMAAGRFARSRSFFRGIPENENVNKGIRELNAANGLDMPAIAGALPVWLELCTKYNKSPLKCDFLAFCGLDFQLLYDKRRPDELTSTRTDLIKMLDGIQADGLRRVVIDGKRSPIGPMFLLKADHGLVEAQKMTIEHVKTDASGAALPVFGADPVQIDENGLK